MWNKTGTLGIAVLYVDNQGDGRAGARAGKRIGSARHHGTRRGRFGTQTLS